MRPPSPPAWPLLGHIPAFRRDVLGLLVRAVRDCGDTVRFQLGPRPVIVVNHPEAIAHVLKARAKNYDKDTRSTAFLRDICGESLLTANGEAWEQRRHLFQPAFHRGAVEGFAAIMREEAAALVGRWRGCREVAAGREMMAVTFRIVARTLFGADLPAETIARLEAPIGVVLAESFARLGSILGRKSRRFAQAMRQLDAAVDAVIADARPAGGSPNLLAMMKAAGFGEAALRREAITFLLAGHETSANALAWLLAFLARHPAEQSRCARDPGALARALQESLRLAPPIWIIERRAIGEDEIGGFSIPAGCSVAICLYTAHRHRDFWEE
ncbi:MAG: cytochrome P450, partial [Verrucomicrobiales bacterium]